MFSCTNTNPLSLESYNSFKATEGALYRNMDYCLVALSASNPGGTIEVTCSGVALETDMDYLTLRENPYLTGLNAAITGSSSVGFGFETTAPSLFARFVTDAVTAMAGFSCTVQERCSPGRWSDTSFTPCNWCPAGSYCTGADHLPEDCPAGKFSYEGAVTCTLCPAGTYGDENGWTTPACTGPCVATPGRVCGPGATGATGHGPYYFENLCGTHAVFSTASFPSFAATSGTNYANNLYCVLTLIPVVTPGVVVVSFASFDLEDGYDFLSVYDGMEYDGMDDDGMDDDLDTMAELTGHGTSQVWGTTGPLTLVLSTDEADTCSGFTATATTMCPVGRFGDPVLTSCVGVCKAPPGSFCGIGATSGVGTLCPAGRYGATEGLTNTQCTGGHRNSPCCTMAPQELRSRAVSN